MSTHDDLIRRLRDPAYDASEEAADAIETLMAERDDMRALLRGLHAETEALVAERDAVVALLRVTRATAHETRMHLNNGPMGRARAAVYGSLGELCARIDALLAGKEPTP